MHEDMLDTRPVSGQWTLVLRHHNQNVAMTAPYMHDGSFGTLREVIDYNDDPDRIVPGAKGRDATMSAPLKLTEGEKADLEAFLRALTDDRFAS